MLDLDETLVHARMAGVAKPDYVLPVVFDGLTDPLAHIYVKERPFAEELLLRLSKRYEIVVFTAGAEECVAFRA